MTDPSIDAPITPRRSSARRREAMINAIATILGCLALVIMIATVVRVVTVKLWDSAKVNPDYVQSVYDDNANERRWSGTISERPALLSEPSKDKAQSEDAAKPAAPRMPPRRRPAPSQPLKTSKASV